MRTALFFLLAAGAFAKDADFNGRWNIMAENEPRRRAWWLEITGAGTPGLAGRFVGAMGGDMETIPVLSIKDGQLEFRFKKPYAGAKAAPLDGIYTARIVKGAIVGDFNVPGGPQKPLHFTGHRAPVIKDREDGRWQAGKPVELFNGKDLSNWEALLPGKPLGWAVENGIMRNVAGANNLVSTEKFWNFELHCEFRLGEHSNSGLGLRGRYEIQILDDYGQAPNSHGTGALYARVPPTVNAAGKPGEWQTYDIRLVGRTLTVKVNGKTVQDKIEVEGLTAVAHDPDEAAPGALSIQGDHGAVEIRKLTITPLIHR